MRPFQPLLLAVAACGAFAAASRADVKPNPLFSDHVVLQRGVPIPVWGSAEPGEGVTVSIAAPDGKATSAPPVAAGADGKWQALLPADLKAGGGYALSIKGKNAVELKNVAVGDVWLCSGQSNMQWTLAQLKKEDQGEKVAAAAANPNLRLFNVKLRPMPEPQATVPVTPADQSGPKVRVEGRWQECTPDAAIQFSAVGYFFGRDIQKDQNVPIGLLNTSYGGTPAEAWTSKEGLEAEPATRHYAEAAEKVKKDFDKVKADAQYKAATVKWTADVEKAKAAKKPLPRQPQPAGPGGVGAHTPAALYNGMVAPLLPFPVKGAIWYQGESNAGRAAEYRKLMPALIADWRAKWKSDLPFFQVQLAPYRGGSSGVDYAELRDAQYHATKVLPKAGIAVITDVGDEGDIHPQRKEPVGQRLALAARAIAYGEKVDYSGPVYKAMKVEGDKAVLTFDFAEEGLACRGEALSGFQIAGEDKKFVPARAEIKGDAVVVSADAVSRPWAVRYGWANFAKPELNFFDKSGLPAVPFRTDDLPLTTAKTQSPVAPPMKKAG